VRKSKAALLAATTAAVTLLGYGQAAALASSGSSPSCHGHRATLVVTASSPHLVRGTSHRDVVEIEDPGHVVRTGAGDDLVCGSKGKDVIDLGAGNDTAFAGAGDDTVTGDGGRDAIHGGAGNDRLSGGSGDDVINGDAGDDRINGDDHGGGHGSDG
jgi:Ca2+-binding RTX toxin-like protein